MKGRLGLARTWAIAVVCVAIMLPACSVRSRQRTVTTSVSGGPTDYSLSYTMMIGKRPSGGHLTPPNSMTTQVKAGTFVSFAVTSFLGPQTVTCELKSDGRVVATASASHGAVATCAGKV